MNDWGERFGKIFSLTINLAVNYGKFNLISYLSPSKQHEAKEIFHSISLSEIDNRLYCGIVKSLI